MSGLRSSGVGVWARTGLLVAVSCVIGVGCSGHEGESSTSPRESAEFIWEEESEDLRFCFLYWR